MLTNVLLLFVWWIVLLSPLCSVQLLNPLYASRRWWVHQVYTAPPDRRSWRAGKWPTPSHRLTRRRPPPHTAPLLLQPARPWEADPSLGSAWTSANRWPATTTITTAGTSAERGQKPLNDECVRSKCQQSVKCCIIAFKEVLQNVYGDCGSEWHQICSQLPWCLKYLPHTDRHTHTH